MKKILHIVHVYRPHSCSIFKNLNNFQVIIKHFPKHYPIIILVDFNIDILKNNNDAKNKQDILYLMNKLKLKSQFNKSSTKLEYQLYRIYIQVNVFENKCKYGVIKANWPNFHTLIHIAFKLTNTLPMYNKKTLIFSFV